jgi:hypothetical protein
MVGSKYETTPDAGNWKIMRVYFCRNLTHMGQWYDYT